MVEIKINENVPAEKLASLILVILRFKNPKNSSQLVSDLLQKAIPNNEFFTLPSFLIH